jgi:hypothetical protein
MFSNGFFKFQMKVPYGVNYVDYVQKIGNYIQCFKNLKHLAMLIMCEIEG